MAEASAIYDHELGQASLCVTRAHGHPTFTEEYVAAFGPAAIITPPAGLRICICGVFVATDAVAGTISLDLLVSGRVVWRHYASRFGAASGTGIHLDGAVLEPLTLTIPVGTVPTFIAVNYRIID